MKYSAFRCAYDIKMTAWTKIFFWERCLFSFSETLFLIVLLDKFRVNYIAWLNVVLFFGQTRIICILWSYSSVLNSCVGLCVCIWLQFWWSEDLEVSTVFCNDNVDRASVWTLAVKPFTYAFCSSFFMHCSLQLPPFHFHKLHASWLVSVC